MYDKYNTTETSSETGTIGTKGDNRRFLFYVKLNRTKWRDLANCSIADAIDAGLVKEAKMLITFDGKVGEDKKKSPYTNYIKSGRIGVDTNASGKFALSNYSTNGTGTTGIVPEPASFIAWSTMSVLGCTMIRRKRRRNPKISQTKHSDTPDENVLR